MFPQIALLHYFSWVSNIHVCVCECVCVCVCVCIPHLLYLVYLLMDIYTASISWLL